MRKFKVGEGVKDGITHGPLIHEAAVNKVQQHVDDAVSKGAKVVVGGKKLDVPGYFFEPTVLADVQSCAIDNEETFGPLAALYRFKTEEEAVEMANNTEVGLAGCVRTCPILVDSLTGTCYSYFFTENIARLYRVAAALEVGMVRLLLPAFFLVPLTRPLVQVGANTGVISQAAIPFGGIKESGFGREGAFSVLFLPFSRPPSAS